MKMSENRKETPMVKNREDFITNDKIQIIVCGRYNSVVNPRKGYSIPQSPKDHAIIILPDGLEIFLEPLDSPESIRPSQELKHFEGKKVMVCGTAHKIMPSKGESLINPCLSNITYITEND